MCHVFREQWLLAPKFKASIIAKGCISAKLDGLGLFEIGVETLYILLLIIGRCVVRGLRGKNQMLLMGAKL